MGDAAQRQVIGLKAVLLHDFLCTEHRPEMAADQTADRSFPDIALRVVFFIPDAEPRAGYNRQILRRVHAVIAPVDGFMQLHRILDPDKGIHADAVAVLYQLNRFIGTHYFKHNCSCPFCLSRNQLLIMRPEAILLPGRIHLQAGLDTARHHIIKSGK